MRLNIIKSYGMPYTEAYQWQKKLVAARQKGEIGDTLFLTSHPHVMTIGRAGGQEHLLVSETFLKSQRIPVVSVERGGDITYHGPGQIVGYPIIDLAGSEKDLHAYVDRLEQTIIDVLREYRIEAGKIKGLTGVWVGKEKITAIGIAVSKWVTWHGFALNVCPDLSFFNYIVPCGIRDKGVTSMEKILGHEMRVEQVERILIEKFRKQFGYDQLSEILTASLGLLDLEGKSV